MKSMHFRRASLAAIFGALLATSGSPSAARAADEDPMMDPTAEERAAEAARGKDPAWKAACEQVALIQVGKSAKGGSVHNYCLNRDGNLLVCSGGSFSRPLDDEGMRTEEVSEPAEIQVYSPDGKLLGKWPLDAMPQAVCVARDGTVFAAGGGRIHRLDARGKVLASVDTPAAREPVTVGKEMEEMLKEQNRLNPQELERMKTMLEKRRAEVTGIAVTDRDLFVACPAPNDFTYRVYRLDHNLKNPKLIVEKLRGCCGQMDIQAQGDNLWIPHNARHQVECRDREGKEISHFGKRGRVKPDQFGGCCEPKNLRFTAGGEILAAESGPPTCIKRFSSTGKFLGVVAMVNTKGDCVRVTVEATPDGKRYYLLDTTRDAIRVFGTKN